MAAEPMNAYGLIAAIVQSVASLAWPIAFVVAVWLFRQKLKELLPLFRLKYKDLEMSFRLEQAEKEAAGLPKPPVEEQQPPPTPEEQSRFNQLANISPRAAMIEMRRELDDAIRRTASRLRVLEANEVSSLTLTRVLRSIGAIDEHTSALLDDLRKIGNTAAHAPGNGFSKEDAKRYWELTNQAIQRLDALPTK